MTRAGTCVATLVCGLILAAGVSLDGDQPAVHGTSPQQVAAAAAAPARVVSPLTKRHAGWRQVACFDCHDADTMARHHADAVSLKVSDCGPCHGYNGAPAALHAVPINPCQNCHAMVSHVPRFTAPGECIGCHAQPERPASPSRP